MKTQKIILLPIFLIICFAVSYFGAQFTPGEWYQQLERAPWSPPNLAFPIVWTILYILIAVAGWQLHTTPSSRKSLLISLWWIQLGVNAAWSWIFFGKHWVGVALLDILLLLLLIIALAVACFKDEQKTPGLLLVPYALWVMLATSLNAHIFLAN